MRKKYVGKRVLTACGKENEDLLMTLAYSFYGINLGSVNALSLSIKISELIDRKMIDEYFALPAAYICSFLIMKKRIVIPDLFWTSYKEDKPEKFVDEIMQVDKDISKLFKDGPMYAVELFQYLLDKDCSSTTKLFHALRAPFMSNVKDFRGDEYENAGYV